MKNNLTLVELLIVIVLIGILSMVAMPVDQQTLEPPTQQTYFVQATSQPENEVSVQ